MKARPFACTALALGITSTVGHADYAMPPIAELLRTVPIVVDATATEVVQKTGAVHLEVHRVYRGSIDAKRMVLTKTMLTCVGAPPGSCGIKPGKRYVFLLQKEDMLYEGSTYWEVTGDAAKPEALRIRFPHSIKPDAPSLQLSEFEKKLKPAAAKVKPQSAGR